MNCFYAFCERYKENAACRSDGKLRFGVGVSMQIEDNLSFSC